MQDKEIAQLQTYLRARLNEGISVRKRPRADDSAEIMLDGEFIAVCYRDEDDGELSYQLNMTILSEDLPE